MDGEYFYRRCLLSNAVIEKYIGKKFNEMIGSYNEIKNFDELLK